MELVPLHWGVGPGAVGAIPSQAFAYGEVEVVVQAVDPYIRRLTQCVES